MQKTARDIMVPLDNYPHARDTQTLRDAVKLLETVQIHFGEATSMPRILLVFDENDHLLGMARRRDILRGLEPEYHQELDTLHPEAHFKTEIDPNLSNLVDYDEDHLKSKLEKPLSEVVRELPGQVSADDSLMKIAREMVGKDTHIVAVMDDGHVVGVARSLEVLHAGIANID